MTESKEFRNCSSDEPCWDKITDEGLVSIVENYQVDQSTAAKALGILAQRRYPYLKVLALWVFMEISAAPTLKEAARIALTIT